MKFLKTLLFSLMIFGLFFSSCKKDQLLTDSSAKLDFSTDSIMFDTVFTTVGSTTKTFRIYNKHSQTMNISKISLAGGSASSFKINVDGVAGTTINNVEIAGGDSLFVFVQVTIDPNSSLSPLLVKDSIVFETNGNSQNVKLLAVGQDVYLHIPDHFPTNGLPPYSIISCNDIWTNDKPHLIFGYAVVDSACTLTMQPGTRVHLYNHAVLWVYKDGTLIVNGTKGNEVTFQGARLEADYKDIPGQWGKIWLSRLSINNKINYAIIKNGGIGLQVDTVDNTTGNPTLKLSNTIIKNMTAAAIYGQGAQIWANNCVFANCGQFCAALTLGGKYNFEFCTFANYWNRSSRTTPLLLMNNYYSADVGIIVRPLDSCYFGNCILYGDQPDEIGIDSITGAGPGFYFNYKFDHCTVRSGLSMPNGVFYNSVWKLDPDFNDSGNNDYHLSSPTANACNIGDPAATITYSVDIEGQNRQVSPDLGAYEFH